MNQKLPLISVIIPTYNEERNIVTCLEAIFRQDYPQDRLEIIVVDNRSLDRTEEIINEYIKKHQNIKLVYNDIEKHAETSKMIGFNAAKGEYFIYLDADIEILSNTWFNDLFKPHLENPGLAGSFGRFWPKKTDTLIGRLLRYHPLELDPVLQFFCTEIESTYIEKKQDYNLCNFTLSDIPPVGICLYKKMYLEKVLINDSRFMDVDIPVKLVKSGYHIFAYVEKTRFYHSSINSLKDLIRKRVRNINKTYLPNIENREYKYFDLMNKRDLLKIIFWIIYVNSFIPGIIQGLLKSIKNRDAIFMYEPVVSLVLTNVIIWQVLKSKIGRKIIISLLINRVNGKV